MRAKDIVIGESYRHKHHPHYFAKAVKVLNPKAGENTTSRIIVKCEYSQQEDGGFGMIKYFSPADLVPNAKINGSP